MNLFQNPFIVLGEEVVRSFSFLALAERNCLNKLSKGSLWKHSCKIISTFVYASYMTLSESRYRPFTKHL